MATVILVGSGLAVKRETRHLRRVIERGRPVPERFGAAYAGDPEPGVERPPAPTGA
jgi:hypothetical protein